MTKIKLQAYLLSVLLPVVVFFIWSGCSEENKQPNQLNNDDCPSPVDPLQELDVEEMQALAASYVEKDVTHLFKKCDAVAVGIDARNGRTVYAEIICDDLCPDYTRQALTYGPETHNDWDDCQENGFCYITMGASPGTLFRCTPVPNHGECF